jgi:hypothetical protein
LSSPDEPPKWKTGWLWVVLALLLVLGSAAAATGVYGAIGLAAGQLLGAVFLAGGAFGAFLAFLFMAGILYRVDRYRGAVGRRIELFE